MAGLTMRKLALGTSVVVSILLGVSMTVKLRNSATFMETSLENKRTELLRKTVDAAAAIDARLMKLKAEVDELAEALSTDALSYDEAMARIRERVRSNELLVSAVIAYEPYRYEEDRRLFAPIVAQRKGRLVEEQIEASYDYTDPGEQRAHWYYATVSEGKRWTDAFYDAASKHMVFSYSASFTLASAKRLDHSPDGVVMFCLGVDNLSDYLKNIDLGPSGYGAVVSHTGRYIAHPKDKYIIDGKTILEIGREKGDPERVRWWKVRREQSSGAWEHISTTTGKESYFIFAKLRGTGFSLHNTFLKGDILLDYDAIRHGQIGNIGYCLLFVLSAIVVLLIYNSATFSAIWSSTAIMSVALIVAIGFTWYIALEYHSKKKLNSEYIINEYTRSKKEEELTNRYRRYGTLVVHKIPTGIYIDDIKFSGLTTISAVGTIWQKFDHGLPKATPRDIVFPSAEVVYLRPKPVHKCTDYDLYRWDFKIDIKQKLDYLEYPLNYERIHVEIQQAESDIKVIPTPDISAYKLTTPTSKMGIREHASMPGWKITESSFSMHTRSLDADFGNGTALANNYFPTLSFDIAIKRKFLDVFISNLTPLILVLFLLFLGLNVSNVSDPYKKLFRADLVKIISFFSGLLFVVAFAHIGIRSKVNAEGLFLLEYFYLISYGAFLYVTITTILYFAEVKRGLISYRSNLVYKTMFWPLILSGILVVSVIIFY